MRLAVVLLGGLVAFATDARAVTISWSLVGDVGNAADPATGSLYGAVDYSYRIGTYEVTNSQYADFLNAKDPTGANSLRLYNSDMSSGLGLGGINYNSGAPNGEKYSVIAGNENHPVNWASWYSAIRFANWLNNSQGNGDTETGAYTLGPLGANGIPLNGNIIARNTGATVFLPSRNEWYKAAYYNPVASSYYRYPTSSDTTPTGTSPTSTPNSVNAFPSGPLSLTDVGAYSGTTSPYGVFDMAGNVTEWTETPIISLGERVNAGGAFNSGADGSRSPGLVSNDPTFENTAFGFRVATVPEPSTLLLAAISSTGVWAHARQRRRRSRHLPCLDRSLSPQLRSVARRMIVSAGASASLIVLSATARATVLPPDCYIAAVDAGVGPVGSNTGVKVTIGSSVHGDPVPPLIFDHLELTPANSGQTFTRTIGDPGFVDFAALLTNGVPDVLAFQVFTNQTNGGSGFSGTEQQRFTSSTGPPFPFMTDFQGLLVQSISLVVHSVRVGGLYVTLDADLAVHVIPEPSTLVLAALGALALVAWHGRVARRTSV